MKEPIYFTLVSRWSDVGYVVLAVTLEKTRQVYGRTLPDNEATHVRRGDCFGRFATLAMAEGRIDALKRVRAEHLPRIEAARAAYTEAQRAETRDIQRVLGEASE